MDASQIGLFSLAERRLAWTNQRQAVLAQNIANASTPGFQPRDVRAFAARLGRVAAITPARTQPGHLVGSSADPLKAASVVQTRTHGPDGNGIALDEQLTKVAETETTQSLVTAIYKKYLTLFSMALGHSA